MEEGIGSAREINEIGLEISEKLGEPIAVIQAKSAFCRL